MNKINLTQLSNSFRGWKSSKVRNDKEGIDQWEDSIDRQLINLPGGSGIDAGMAFDWEKSKPERLLFRFAFHHMDEHGYYDGWTEHELIITLSLPNKFRLSITGRNRNQIKDYLYDLFYNTFDIDQETHQQAA